MEANNQANKDDVFIEYLENMKLFNLIFTLDVSHLLKYVTIIKLLSIIIFKI